MEIKKPTCQNCENPYEEGFEFCPHCGQKTNENLTIGVLFYNTISNYFSFDARFLKSFIPLMFRPGYLANKFLEGKRLLFLHPAQMYLFVSVIFFFILSFSTRKLVAEADDKINRGITDTEKIFEKTFDSLRVNNKVIDSIKTEKILSPLKQNKELLGLTDEDFKITDSIVNAANSGNNGPLFNFNFNGSRKKVDSLIKTGADDRAILVTMGMSKDTEEGDIAYAFYKKMLDLKTGEETFGSIIQAFFDTIPISMFFLLPLFALILKLFYYKRGRYTHHLVFSFYFFSFLFTVFSIIFAINLFIDYYQPNPGVIDSSNVEYSNGIPGWINALIVLSTYIYFYIALLNFYKRNWFFTLIKSGVITFIFLMMVLPLAFTLLASFSFFIA